MITISVVITTYNRPDALNAVLLALEKQTDLRFEAIIADDGSTQETATLINSFQKKHKFLITHVWQSDDGFQAAKIRNKGILASNGDYIIFIDGDCVPRPHFISRHRKLAECGYFVGGNRSLLSADYTKAVLNKSLPIESFNLLTYTLLGFSGKINRWFTLLLLPMGFLRYKNPMRWRGIKTCNLAIWKKDLLAINGFDESYIGWGYEDSDLVIRLIQIGIKHKSGRFSTTVLHLWHQENNREREETNYYRLDKLKNNCAIK